MTVPRSILQTCCPTSTSIAGVSDVKCNSYCCISDALSVLNKKDLFLDGNGLTVFQPVSTLQRSYAGSEFFSQLTWVQLLTTASSG